ncbi:unnamed protein product [marine sediment metagenome]|uniref:Uncharacterized protein n=1 Tax=marine sediment metagenome TaxID=412755 RepID=X0ZQS2_9ZZZZ
MKDLIMKINLEDSDKLKPLLHVIAWQEHCYRAITGINPKSDTLINKGQNGKPKGE